MTTQHRAHTASRHAPSRQSVPPAQHRHREQAMLALLALAGAVAIFRAILEMGDDVMLALLAPVVVFLLVASLLAGDDRRRL